MSNRFTRLNLPPITEQHSPDIETLRVQMDGLVPEPFLASFASLRVFNLVHTNSPVTVMVPAGDEHASRSGKLLTMNDEYFAIVSDGLPYLFLPDQIESVATIEYADGSKATVITLAEAPVLVPDVT